MKLKRFMIPFWGYSLGILIFVLLVKFGFISTESIGISVTSLEVVMIIYALILGLSQVARQTNRLKKLSAIATDLGNGHMGKRSDELEFDSIGNLAHAINKMADQIQQSFGDLQEVGQNLEAQNDELHEVLKTEARFGAYLESIAVVDTGDLAKTGLRAIREVSSAEVAWLICFDPEAHQQICYCSTPQEFRMRQDCPYPGNMREISARGHWENLSLDSDDPQQGRKTVLQIPIQFDEKPLGVVFLETTFELEGRAKRLLGNYLEAFSNALSNCISYQAALRQSIRLEELNKELLLADQNRNNFV
ncbi:MAG: hypothetical protein KJT03_04385, partial [Verrucomicrobiae bacterium]|nr:hypothetical protein [Verrucomicrobiae bacterium]